jgi:multicomponent Na+:H+ antiporter subunit C
MTTISMAIAVGVLFASGVYLLLQRSPIRLILGLGLLTHGVNLLLFSTGGLRRGVPPIIMDKAAFAGDISQFVDPLPQALILTAIVISFGVTAFVVALVNRRNMLLNTAGELSETRGDPFSLRGEPVPTPADYREDDYEYLEDTLVGQYHQQPKAATIKEQAIV